MGDRRQHSWLAYVERWTSRVTPSSRCPGTRRLRVRLQADCSAAWERARHRRGRRQSMQQVASSRCSLRCDQLRARALVVTLPDQVVLPDVSARRLLDALRPGLVTQRLEHRGALGHRHT